MNKLKKIFLTAVATLTVATVSAAGEEPAAESYRNNRHPLLQKDYIQLPLGTIRAEGWMHDQLTRMRDGMTGHLDKVYTKVMGPRNGWLGGDGDVWERGPYWIDGLLPLAYLLNDQALIEKVQPWIEWTLASQKPNGYFGPDTDRDYEPGLQRNNAQDWWPKMVMLKVMQQYYTATQDRRVIDFMTRYFRYQLDELPKNPLGKWTFWGEQRGGDNLMVVYWLYNITGDKFLLDLGELIHKQTFNWTDIFLNQNHLRRQHSLHCVNLAQGFKEPIVYYQQGKDSKQIQATRQAVNDIRHTIGLPTGLWGGDELLRFGKPTTGSELCTAVEMMYSLETILEVTGDMQWADYLERVAYNALPTQVTDDYSARQYYQQTNQIAVTREWREFFPFHLRIPGWCKQPVVKLNGKPLTVDAYPGTVTRINREWKEGDILSLELPMEVTVSRWYENSAVVERGPLVYALKMNEKWEKKAFESDKSDVYGKWYYEVTSDSPWNYALPARSFSPDRIKDAFTVEKSDITTPYPWNVENAPIRIKTKAMRLNGWTQVRGSAGPVPYYTQQGKDFGDEETIELIPYGCTTLRITEFPVR